jgi:hypothetical protein
MGQSAGKHIGDHRQALDQIELLEHHGDARTNLA